MSKPLNAFDALTRPNCAILINGPIIGQTALRLYVRVNAFKSLLDALIKLRTTEEQTEEGGIVKSG
jgi:hypothetical protein